jgi:anti-anti-sigma factor
MNAISGDQRDGHQADGVTAASCTHKGFDVHSDGSAIETTVRVTGALDEMIAPILRRTLDRIDVTRLSRIVLDIESLHFIDSAGLGVVESLQARCAAAGREFLIEPSPSTLHDLTQRAQA